MSANGWRGMVLAAWAGLAGLALAACSDDPNRAYVELAGGGFIFNYRIAEAHYGLVLKPARRIPEGTTIEAAMENPAGGAPIVLTKVARGGETKFVFDSPPLRGVVKDKPYRVAVRVLAPEGGTELQRLEASFASDFDQSILPERPLTLGPGYARNVTGETEAFPKALDAPAR